MAGGLPHTARSERGIRAVFARPQCLAGVGSLFAALMFPAQIQAACVSATDCLREIERAQEGTRSLSARFVQTKHLSLLDEPLVSRGRFVFARPGRILWAVEEPQSVRVVIDGDDVRLAGISERDRAALAMSPLTTMLSHLAAVFAGSVGVLEQDFEVSAADDGAGIQLTLAPRREAWKRMFRVVRFRFERPLLTVRAIELEDALGDRLAIQLSDVERNVDVPDSLFEGP